jgi:hypothetical protein
VKVQHYQVFIDTTFISAVKYILKQRNIPDQNYFIFDLWHRKLTMLRIMVESSLLHTLLHWGFG